MTRTRLFLRGVISGYASIFVNILFSLFSIPLALHYLGKEDFGLWVLIVQLSGYLSLLDLGMSVSISRFLADYMDDINGGHYGSVLKTGQVVFVVQGSLIVLFGAAAVFWAPQVLHIPVELVATFSILMLSQALLTAASFATRMINSPLWCHQRYDINNLAASISLITNFCFMWLGFYLHYGIYAMLLGAGTGFLVGLFIPLFACLKLGLYPRKGCWGKFNFKLFREIFRFGQDIFLMSLGSQMTSASQVILVSRLLGLDAASIWAVCTKTYSMGQQLVSRILDSAAGGLTELHVRRDLSRINIRFNEITSITTALSGTVGVGLFLFNQPFISLWTQGKVSWNIFNNLLLGILLLTTTTIRCHTGLCGITKDVRGMKFIYLTEGIAFLVLGYFLGRVWGFSGILISSIFCNVAIVGVYAIIRSRDLFQKPLTIILKPIVRPLTSLFILLFSSLPIFPYVNRIENWFSGITIALLWLILAGLIFWFSGLMPNLREQIRRRFLMKFD